MHRGSGACTAKRYYNIGGITVAVRDSAGAGSLNYLLGDQLGSTTVSVNSATGAASTQRFLPYGAQRSGSISATDRGWIGQTKDNSTGLQYLNARYYDPTIGRFTATDPLINTSQTASLDAYGYGRGNPVTLSDPTGLDPDTSAIYREEARRRGGCTASCPGGEVLKTPAHRSQELLDSLGDGAAPGVGRAEPPSGLSAAARSAAAWAMSGVGELNNAEWKACWNFNLDRCRSLGEIREFVWDTVDAEFGPGFDARKATGVGEANAFQHQLLAAVLASEWSEDSAWALLDAHEQEDDGFNPHNEYVMDTVNNAIGVGTALRIEQQTINADLARTIGGAYFSVPRADLVVAVRANIRSGNYVAIERQG